MTLLRKLFSIAATKEFKVNVKHIPGSSNYITDCLSCLQVENLCQLVPDADRYPTPIPASAWQDWLRNACFFNTCHCQNHHTEHIKMVNWPICRSVQNMLCLHFEHLSRTCVFSFRTLLVPSAMQPHEHTLQQYAIGISNSVFLPILKT